MNMAIRQIHRWVSLAFTLAVVAIFTGPALGTMPEWFYYLPAFPLVLLLPSGLYLFVQPYVGKRRRGRSAPARA
ncbi:hypothetical protein [Microvirga puerhi]|uniref:Uncharacterized protein n=1 Tax=Microvirga puerhi TaxID=2876078 RepID=A0ABS7VMD3_9HYPH|nr:hypothetical protein [Microvirga puerhi]MBZ6076321.1 hypothetical protein [Microvirga puerhi]